jgi:hypothetical protein
MYLFFLACSKGISWKVWIADRIFPVVPPFKFLAVPSIVHLILFIVSLSTLLALLIFPSNKKLQIGVIVIEVLSCLLDQNRWQPWEYQYIFIILALVINYKNDKTALASIAFIFISIYFFSGLGKMNPLFSQYLRNVIVGFGIFHESNSRIYNMLFYHVGYLLGIIEILLSIGLLFSRTVKAAAIFLILMHLCILVIFGPLGINYDKIIWPWNIAMIVCLYILFIRSNPEVISLQLIKPGWNKLLIVLFGILPFLNFFGYWDYYLSASLFSYRAPDMYVHIHNQEKCKELQPYFSIYKNKLTADTNTALINIREWSFKEMEVPAYPELRVYKSIKQQLLKRYPDLDATFIVYPFLNGKKNSMELK